MAGFDQTAAVVTGASSGIGRSIALSLAEAGVDRLIVHYRRNESGAKQTAEAVRRHGTAVTLVQADLSSQADRQRLVESAFAQLGTICTWVNNAGADVLTGDAANLNFNAKLRKLIEVDVLGTIDLSRIVADRLQSQALSIPSSITFIGWDQACHGMEGDAGQMFASVKAALMAFALSLAQSVGPNIRVNTIAPGWIQTSWGESTSKYWDERARAQSLMQRWGKPEDVAKAVVYLADPDNSFVTGQTIDVNGGWNRKFPRPNF